MGPGHEEEAHGRVVGLIRQDRGKCDARVIVDRYVQILPAHTTRLLVAVAGDIMTWLTDARRTLGIEVDQVTGPLANHRWWRIEGVQTVEPGMAQDATHRRSAQLQLVGDMPAVPALSAQFKNLFQ